MPKMKTRSSATKRFKLTASGKLKKNKADTGRVKSMIGK